VATLNSKQQWSRHQQLQQHMHGDSNHDSYIKNEKYQLTIKGKHISN